MLNPNPIASGLFILPDDLLYASDRLRLPTQPIYSLTTREDRIHSAPAAVNYARPFEGSNNLIPIDNKRSNSYSSSSSSSTATSTSLTSTTRSVIILPTRRVSRKSPPKITGSLEDLSRSVSCSTKSEYSPLTPSLNFMPTQTFILPVDPPTEAFLAPPRPPPRSSRRPPPPELPRQATSMDNLLPSSVPNPNASRITLQFPSRPQPSPTTSTTPPRLSPANTSTASSLPRTPRTPTRIHVQRPSESSSSANPLTCSSGSASTCGTWSLADEVDMADRGSPRVKESRKARKLRKIEEEERFDVDTPPSVRELFEASLLEVIGEDGKRVKFGDLIKRRKTIVVFIRHWFCPLCAQYMNSIISEVSQDALYEADVELIIIGNGSGKMLPAYKNKGFKCPFQMYTDPSLLLYRALGLTRKTGNAGPDADKGDYIVQTGLESTVQTIKRATVMPLRNPGHFTQLGGEFIFSGPLNLEWTHRMTTTRDHAPIRDICKLAGVQLEFIHYEPGPSPPPVHRRSYLGGIDGEETGRAVWMEERDEEVERIRALKAERRAGRYGADQVRIIGMDDVEVEGEGEGYLENAFGRVVLGEVI